MNDKARHEVDDDKKRDETGRTGGQAEGTEGDVSGEGREEPLRRERPSQAEGDDEDA